MSKYRVPTIEQVKADIEEATEGRIGMRIDAIVAEYIAPAIQNGETEVTIDVINESNMAYLVERLGDGEAMSCFGDVGYYVTMSERDWPGDEAGRNKTITLGW